MNILKLDKRKCYCNQCFKLDIITELQISSDDKNNYTSQCEHAGKYFSHLKWCDKCQNFTYHRGVSTNAECYSCVMSRNSLKAIENGVHSCQNPETSLANKELHQKTIDNQIKNGTFNMMNSEIHAKATENKLKNYSSGECTCTRCGKKAKLNSYKICSDCQSKIGKEVVENNKKPGNCTICGVYNEKRSQNAIGMSDCNCWAKQMLKMQTSEARIKANKIHVEKLNGKIEFCDKCQKETYFKYSFDSKEWRCTNCTGEKVWCEHCQRYETIIYNSKPDHWIFYKSSTKIWMDENPDLVEFLEDYIIGFQSLIDANHNICGIYEWLVNDKSWYIGQSTDILSRSYDHMKSFYENPEYFDFQQRTDIEDIINDENYSIGVRVLEECEKEELNEREVYWIDKNKPYSQKCDGTDSIKSLEERN